ncbi:MAG: hypothetical protein LUQ52_10165, partial [Methylococcaceae bacterium]|nr:hypothetical protein [Methylococcaceae bacterium]
MNKFNTTTVRPEPFGFAQDSPVERQLPEFCNSATYYTFTSPFVKGGLRGIYLIKSHLTPLFQK